MGLVESVNYENSVESVKVGGEFSKDPYYFHRYYKNQMVFFIAVDLILVWLSWGAINSSFTLWHLALLPISIYLGGISAVFMHNASHRSFRPIWLNRLIGEITGTHQLYGFLGWKTAHMIHHRFPDDHRFDPHPPLDYTYLHFTRNMQKSLRDCITNFYLNEWGDDNKYKKIWAQKNFFAVTSIFAKLIFWYLILGKAFFFAFYIPSYLTQFIFFSHFNYFTHRPGKNGEVEILNLNHNWIYKLMNQVWAGVYFHKNHHLKASVFNPRNIEIDKK